MNHSGLFLIGAVLFAAGCSSGDEWSERRPAVAPADGIVTLQGKPVEGATVIFAPATAGGDVYGASAMTDSDGRFSAAAFPPEYGVVPGQYKVAVSKVEASETNISPEAHDQPRRVAEKKHLVPEKFGDPATSGLTVEIPEGGKIDIQLDLK